MSGISRRAFIRSAAAGSVALAAPRFLGAAAAERRPNVIFIVTDQQHAGMMSCTGNRWLNTPAMDRLAASGTRFERAYTANPVCLPARFSFFTGHMPSKVGIGLNADGRRCDIPGQIVRQSMGRLFKDAGYETVYGGKTHLPKGMGLANIGFRRLTGDARGKLADACVRFLKGRHERPFLLVASFINPHDICYMGINDHRRSVGGSVASNRDSMICEGLIEEPRKRLEEFVEKHCPPLPGNFDKPELEPECITEKYVNRRKFRQYAREKWSPQMWRLHRWAYCRLTEMVDAHVGKVIDAVRDAGLGDNTVVVFTSDHGDHDAAHRLEHKSILYEEAARIPFILSYRGVVPAGKVDTAHLVSNGLDLLPTLCDYAGIAPPSGLLGASVKPIAAHRPAGSWRDHVAVESQNGRMVRTARHKYVIYDSGANREQLFDLKEDPGEMRNLVQEPAQGAVLGHCRGLLCKWVEQAQDAIGRRYVIGPGEVQPG